MKKHKIGKCSYCKEEKECIVQNRYGGPIKRLICDDCNLAKNKEEEMYRKEIEERNIKAEKKSQKQWLKKRKRLIGY